MRRRRSGAWAIAWLLAVSVAFVPATKAQSIDGLPQSQYLEHRDRFTPAGGAPIDLRFLIARSASRQLPRVVAATHAAVTLLSTWFGPLAPSLTVAGVPWRRGVSVAASPGLVTAPLRWLTPGRDQSTERALIVGLVRQYWSGAASTGFDESVIIYAGARAVHQLLEGSNFATAQFFGGTVPFPLRSILLSPPVADPRPRVWRFDELESGKAAVAEVARGVRALQSLERLVGWPTLLDAISRMREGPLESRDAEGLATALSVATGTDLRPLVLECFRADAVFDYSLAGVESEPGPTGLFETTIAISRPGSGRFATRDASGDRETTMALLVRFADGTQVFDYFDGEAATATMVYSAKAPALGAVIDPDRTLMLDVNRENNVIARDTRTSVLGVRLALHWMAWLQNAMLSYTALL